MKKKLKYSLLILSVLVVSFIFGVWLRTKTEMAPVAKKSNQIKESKSPRFKAIMKEALRKKEDVKQGDDYSCRKDLSDLLTTSVEEIENQMEAEPIAIGDDCVKSISALSSLVMDAEMQKCVIKGKMGDKEACHGLIAFLRAYLLTQEAQKKELKDRELSELIAELLWNMVKGKSLSEADVDRNLAIANEMIDRDPSMYDAYKAKVVNLFLAEMNHKRKVDEEFDKSLEEMSSLGVSDPEVDSLSLIRVVGKGEWKKVNTWADERMDSNPDDYRGFYAKSAYFWQNKNADEAIRYMNRAVSLNPQDASLKKTLDGLKSKDFSMQHYQMKIGFKFDDF